MVTLVKKVSALNFKLKDFLIFSEIEKIHHYFLHSVVVENF